MEDVSFEVASGEIFGILGPNGAGKTTIVECRPDARPVNGVFGLYGMDLSASEGHRVGVARTNGQPANNH